MPLEIKLFGPPQILLDGVEFDTERRKAIALLAYLAVERGDQPREHLAALLWPEYNRESALAYLRRELYEITNQLGKDWVRANRRQAGLAFSPQLTVDVHRFDAAVTESRTAPDARPLLQAALETFRGEFLAGFYLADTEPFEDWQRQQAETYRRAYADALERLAALHEQAGDWPAALTCAHDWLSLDELNESAHRALMRIYAGMGDRHMAVRQYEVCRSALHESLGVPPQAETTHLYERILSDQFDLSQPAAAPAQLDGGAGNAHLPVLTTPFIGRRPEIEQIKELVLRPDNRLVTLFGPGGTGKTRLSIQAGAELCERFPEGVYFVPLAAVENAAWAVSAIAKALNLSFHKEDEQPRRQLLDYLSGKQLLLILDNMEHLIGADMTGLLMDILTGAERARLLVTTRVRLNFPGEQLFQVTGMRLPSPATAAAWTAPEVQAAPFSGVLLFLDRARRVHPDYHLTTRNAAAIAEVCSLVDGLPLGIELAASWLELLPPEDIAAEIRRSMDFLETDRPDVPERQRSIRAVFDYSWKLLNDIEKEAFLNLCVFVGSFSNDAGRQVGGASLRTLLSLANKSWLQQGEDGRFQLHPLLRHYGRELLRADEATWNQARERHAMYYAGLVADLSQRMRGSGQHAALDEFTEEFSTNVKAAWDWLVDQARWTTVVENMAVGLFQIGVMRWRGDVLIEWFRTARKKIDPAGGRDARLAAMVIGVLEIYFEEDWSVKENRPEERLAVLWRSVIDEDLAGELGLWFVILGTLYAARNEAPEAEALIEAEVERLRQQSDPWLYAMAILVRSNFWGGFVVRRSEDRVREALAIFKKLDVPFEQGAVLRFLADNAAASSLSTEEVIDLYLQAQQQFLKLNDRFGAGMVFWNLANLNFTRGAPEQGFAAYHEMRRVFEDLGHQRLVGVSLSWESLWAVRFSTFDHALSIRLRSLEHNRKHSPLVEPIWDLFELGEVYRIFGDRPQAQVYYRQAREEFEQIGVYLGLGYSERAQGDIAMTEGRYADALRDYESFSGLAARDHHLWSMAQALARIGWAKAHLGDLAGARANISECLTRLTDTIHHELVLVTLLTEVRCLVEEGKFEAAASLAAYIIGDVQAWNEMKDLGRGLLAGISEKVPLAALEAASQKYQGRELQSLMDEWMQNYRAGRPGLG